MMLRSVLFICTIALCSADEDTQESDPVGVFPHQLQDFVRRLTHHQMQTTQNMQSALLPQLNYPLFRPRQESKSSDDSPLPLLKFPFQSNPSEEGARSYASSSASLKRPHTGGNVEARASAFASVKDVNDEEHLGESLDSSAQSVTTTGYHKKYPAPEEMVSESADADEFTKPGEPNAMKHQRMETVIKAEDSFSDIYFIAIVAGCCAAGIFGVISAGICFYKGRNRGRPVEDG